VSEPIVVLINNNITDRQRPLVEAFTDYLWSREAQQLLVDYGFQSVLEELSSPDQFMDAEDAFTLEDLGGARVARREILEAVWKDRVLPEVER
jgi:ABC-type sulfate transport system substrate-binding protein